MTPLVLQTKRIKIGSDPGRSLPPKQLAQDCLSLVACCSPATEVTRRLVPRGRFLSLLGDSGGELCKELLAEVRFSVPRPGSLCASGGL